MADLKYFLFPYFSITDQLLQNDTTVFLIQGIELLQKKLSRQFHLVHPDKGITKINS